MMRTIRAGSEVLLRVNAKDAAQSPPSLFDPSGGVTILLTAPDGTVALNDAAMTAQGNGAYLTRYQTTPTSPTGVWKARFKTINGGTTVYTQDFAVFRLV
jgi:uncharacterized protein YfaS (alpha-2-macroglobulin family)